MEFRRARQIVEVGLCASMVFVGLGGVTELLVWHVLVISSDECAVTLPQPGPAVDVGSK